MALIYVDHIWCSYIYGEHICCHVRWSYLMIIHDVEYASVPHTPNSITILGDHVYDDLHIWPWSMMIMYDDHIWWSCNHIWWSYDDRYIYMVIIYDEHVRWSYVMIIYEDHKYMVNIYDDYETNRFLSARRNCWRSYIDKTEL